jgi:predicted ABC-class ATPase
MKIRATERRLTCSSFIRFHWSVMSSAKSIQVFANVALQFDLRDNDQRYFALRFSHLQTKPIYSHLAILRNLLRCPDEVRPGADMAKRHRLPDEVHRTRR